MARTGHERCLLPTLNKELPSLLRSASKGDEKPMIFKASKKDRARDYSVGSRKTNSRKLD
jgi:hypothetical protein